MSFPPREITQWTSVQKEIHRDRDFHPKTTDGHDYADRSRDGNRIFIWCTVNKRWLGIDHEAITEFRVEDSCYGRQGGRCFYTYVKTWCLYINGTRLPMGLISGIHTVYRYQRDMDVEWAHELPQDFDSTNVEFVRQALMDFEYPETAEDAEEEEDEEDDDDVDPIDLALFRFDYPMENEPRYAPREGHVPVEIWDRAHQRWYPVNSCRFHKLHRVGYTSVQVAGPCTYEIRNPAELSNPNTIQVCSFWRIPSFVHPHGAI